MAIEVFPFESKYDISKYQEILNHKDIIGYLRGFTPIDRLRF